MNYTQWTLLMLSTDDQLLWSSVEMVEHDDDMIRLIGRSSPVAQPVTYNRMEVFNGSGLMVWAGALYEPMTCAVGEHVNPRFELEGPAWITGAGHS